MRAVVTTLLGAMAARALSSWAPEPQFVAEGNMCPKTAATGSGTSSEGLGRTVRAIAAPAGTGGLAGGAETLLVAGAPDWELPSGLRRGRVVVFASRPGA